MGAVDTKRLVGGDLEGGGSSKDGQSGKDWAQETLASTVASHGEICSAFVKSVPNLEPAASLGVCECLLGRNDAEICIKDSKVGEDESQRLVAPFGRGCPRIGHFCERAFSRSSLGVFAGPTAREDAKANPVENGVQTI